jgi:phospholipase C
MGDSRYTRRQVLAGGLGAAAALGMSGSGLRRAQDTIRRAATIKQAGTDIEAVEHVIFLMHENRSFDHYFGTMGGVNGFGAKSKAFAQKWPGGTDPTLLPFHLDTQNMQGECTFDLSHEWQAEHASWNAGKMDSFVKTHVSSTYEGPQNGTMTMGYYEQQDLAYYYALAEAFTICDNYFCSVLGPTHPNRMMQMTGTLDPAGAAGGPILTTSSNEALIGTCSWKTMPEVLNDAGVSWKVYNPHGSEYIPGSGLSMTLCKNILMYFEQYGKKVDKKLFKQAFGYYGPTPSNAPFGSVGPDNFATDIKHDKLPAVSWLVPPDGFDEHPPAPPALGMWYTDQVLQALLANPTVWAKTVLFIMYDENDGWFDHVAPPVAPAGTAGEYVTTSPLPADAGGIAGPVGLGVRVPMMVVSPFSAGGWVNSDVLDHTSQLKFLATRFGVTVPNISAWRSQTVGDLTGTLPTLNSPITTKPTGLPATSNDTTKPPISGECSGSQILELNPQVPPYPIPSPQVMPTQGSGTLKKTPT